MADEDARTPIERFEADWAEIRRLGCEAEWNGRMAEAVLIGTALALILSLFLLPLLAP